MESATLDFHCELKKLSDEPGSFEGHASVFGKEDSVQDTVIRGAFKQSLEDHKEAGRMPALLWQHDTHEPIGVWDEMKEDRRGLAVKGQLFVEDIPKARQAHALLKANALSGLSIGFQTVDSETDEKTGRRKLKQVNLWEVSLVTFPAQSSARVTAVKELLVADIKSNKDLEDALRDAGFSKTFAAYVVAGWQSPARRDAGGDSQKELLASLERLKALITP